MHPRLHLTWLLLLFSSHVASQAVNATVDDNFSYSTTNRAGIQYFPSESSWVATAATDTPQRFNGTLHLTNTTSTQAMFFFQGDAIYYYGDKGPGYGVVVINIDGVVGAYDVVNASSSTLEYQQLLWSRTGLGSGDHQIIISKDDTKGTGQISVDYFRIVSSNNTIVPSLSGPGASVVPDQALIVDNTDDGIRYSGGWELVRSPNGQNSGFYRNTVHRTTVPSAIATFTFNGTAVWYFSDIDGTHGLVQISVDGGPAEQVSGFHQPILSQRLIWYKTGLSASEHVVTITHGGTPTQYATVDFFRYLPSNATLPTASSSTPSGSTGGGNEPRPVPVGTMIGGILGGVIGLGAILCGIFLIYRRRTQWASYVPKKSHLDMRPAPEMVDVIEPYETTPFIVQPGPQATTPAQTQSSRLKSSNPGYLSSHSHPSSASELGFYSSAGTSGGFTNYSQYDLPPSYQ